MLLADAGLQVLAIERDVEVYRLPRAVNLDGEIIRAFQASGRAQHISDLMQTPRPGERAGFADSKRQWLFGQAMSDFGTNGWQPLNMFDQPELEAYLRKEATDHPNVTAHIGHAVTALEDDEAGVTVRHHPVNSEDQSGSRVRYVIACDGASSATRKFLGIEWMSLGYDRNWLVVDVTVNDRHTLGVDTLQVCDPKRLTTYVCTKDPYRRWEFCLQPDETPEQMLEEETIRTLLDEWTPRDSYEIRRAAVYQFHAAIAEQWQAGHILIAGDAAHQTPPFLGQGMNAGMRDAINLAWKLPRVVRGESPDTLLESYYLERSSHAEDLVEWAVSIGRLMEHTAAVEQATQEGREPPDVPEEIKRSGYGLGREQPPLRDGVVMREQVDSESLVGTLLPQPIVQCTDVDLRMDDLMGEGFTLVTTSDSSLQLNESARALMKKMRVSLFELDGLNLSRGKLHPVLEKGESIIVRPDHIVFGQTTEHTTIEHLLKSLAGQLLPPATKGDSYEA